MDKSKLAKIRLLINKGDKCRLREGVTGNGSYYTLPEPEIGVIIDIYDNYVLVQRKGYIEAFSYVDIALGDNITLI